jgi:hypothetical protein
MAPVGFRKHIKAAAAIVFAGEPEKAALLGGYHLRHFIGTFLANRAGTNLAAASYVMGHTDLSTTSTYVHADEGEARRLLEGVEKERLKAAREAQKWARARNSDPIRIRSPRPVSKPTEKPLQFRALTSRGERIRTSSSREGDEHVQTASFPGRRVRAGDGVNRRATSRHALTGNGEETGSALRGVLADPTVLDDPELADDALARGL